MVGQEQLVAAAGELSIKITIESSVLGFRVDRVAAVCSVVGRCVWADQYGNTNLCTCPGTCLLPNEVNKIRLALSVVMIIMRNNCILSIMCLPQLM